MNPYLTALSKIYLMIVKIDISNGDCMVIKDDPKSGFIVSGVTNAQTFADVLVVCKV